MRGGAPPVRLAGRARATNRFRPRAPRQGGKLDQARSAARRAPTRPLHGLVTPIRELFAGGRMRARAATIRALLLQRQGGRCEACQGDGVPKVDAFLPTSDVPATSATATLHRETLESATGAQHPRSAAADRRPAGFFAAVPAIRKSWRRAEVGLAYIQLGQAPPRSQRRGAARQAVAGTVQA